MPFAVEYKNDTKEGRDEEDDGEGREMEARGKGHDMLIRHGSVMPALLNHSE